MQPDVHSQELGHRLPLSTLEHVDAGPPVRSRPMRTLFTLAGTALAHVLLTPQPYVMLPVIGIPAD